MPKKVLPAETTPASAWAVLEQAIAKAAPTWLGDLCPPANRDDIAAAERALGFALPDDVAAFYATHNGQRSDQNLNAEIFSQGDFMPLTGKGESLVREWQGLFGSEGAESSGANAKWLPFATDYAGNYLCFDDCARVVFLQQDENKTELIAKNIGEFLVRRAHELSGESVALPTDTKTTLVVNDIADCELGKSLSLKELASFGAEFIVVDPRVVWEEKSKSSFYDPRFDDSLADRKRTIAFTILAGSERPSSQGIIQAKTDLRVADWQLDQKSVRLIDRSGVDLATGFGFGYYQFGGKGKIPVWYVQVRSSITAGVRLEIDLEHRDARIIRS